MDSLLGTRVVVIEFGAGINIATVRRFSEQASVLLDAPLIRVNPREPDVSGQGVGLALGAEEASHQLWGEQGTAQSRWLEEDPARRVARRACK